MEETEKDVGELNDKLKKIKSNLDGLLVELNPMVEEEAAGKPAKAQEASGDQSAGKAVEEKPATDAAEEKPADSAEGDKKE